MGLNLTPDIIFIEAANENITAIIDDVPSATSCKFIDPIEVIAEAMILKDIPKANNIPAALGLNLTPDIIFIEAANENITAIIDDVPSATSCKFIDPIEVIAEAMILKDIPKANNIPAALGLNFNLSNDCIALDNAYITVIIETVP